MGWRWWLVVGFTAGLVFMLLWRRPLVASSSPSAPLASSGGSSPQGPV